MCITSPPYATQREYDSIERVQADPAGGVRGLVSRTWPRTSRRSWRTDGSYFLNIKEHADDGERNLYVKDLVIAHRRQWGWRFVDEFCWRKTDNGVPGGWGNRFKNAWEPVFHFCRQQQIKFRPKAVGHESEDCFDYSPEQPEVDVRQRAAGHRAARRGGGWRQEPERVATNAEQPVRRFGGPARRHRAASAT